MGTKHLNVELPADLIAEIKRRAKEEGMTLPGFMRKVLLEVLKLKKAA